MIIVLIIVGASCASLVIIALRFGIKHKLKTSALTQIRFKRRERVLSEMHVNRESFTASMASEQERLDTIVDKNSDAYLKAQDHIAESVRSIINDFQTTIVEDFQATLEEQSD